MTNRMQQCTKVVGRFSIPSLLIGLQSDEEYGSFSDAEVITKYPTPPKLFMLTCNLSREDWSRGE